MNVELEIWKGRPRQKIRLEKPAEEVWGLNQWYFRQGNDPGFYETHLKPKILTGDYDVIGGMTHINVKNDLTQNLIQKFIKRISDIEGGGIQYT